jgi:hypothetical protein
VGKVYSTIDDRIAGFIESQRLFFVGTAPLDTRGHINISPKGHDTFRILDPHTVAYLDLTGSGVETIAHLRENARIVIMFCALEGAPQIVRLHGRGEVIEPEHPEFPSLRGKFPCMEGVRSVVRVVLDRIADSCGYGVPKYRYEGERDQLREWAIRKGADGIRQYQADHNAVSVDQLPGLPTVGRRSS